MLRFFGWGSRRRRRAVKQGATTVEQLWLSAAFGVWQHKVDVARKTDRAVRSLQNSHIRKVWTSWIMGTAEKLHELNKLSHSLKHCLHRDCARGWVTWQAFLEVLLQLEVLKGALARLMQRELARGLSAWLVWWEELTQRHNALQRGLHQQLAGAFGTWTEVSGEAAERVRLSRKGMGFIMQHGLALGMASWRAALEERAPLAIAINFFFQRELARSWMSWRTLFEEYSQKREALGPVLVRLHQRQLSTAWGSWVDSANERAEQERIARKAWSFALQRGLALGMGLWRDMCAMQRAEAAVLTRMINRHLAQGFGSWYKWHVELAHEGDAKSRSLSRMLRRQLSLAWLSWSEAAMEQRAAKERKLEAARRALVGHELSRGWNSWMAYYEEIAQLHLALRQGLAHMLHQQQARGFASWTETAAQRAEQTRLGRKVIAFTLHRGLVLGMVSWRAATTLGTALNLAQSMLHRLINRQLSLGFRSWAEWVERQEMNRQRLLEALAYFMNREAGRSWTAWREMIEDLAHRLGAVNHTMSRMMQRGMLRGLDAWKQAYCRWCEAYSDNPMVRAANYLRSRELTHGFSAWLGAFREWQRSRKGLKFIANPGMAHAMASWRGLVVELLHVREALIRVISSRLLRSLYTWHEAVKELLHVSRALIRVIKNRVARGFDTWHEAARERAADREISRKARNFIVNPGTARAVASWRELVAEHLHLHAALIRVINSRLLRSLYIWHGAAGEQFDQRNAIRKALQRMLEQRLARGWDTWHEAAIEQIEQQNAIQQALQRMFGQRLARGWSTFCGALASRDDPMASALRHILYRSLSRGWIAWCLHLEDVAHRKSVMQKLHYRGLSLGWLAWCSHLEDLAYGQSVMNKSVGRLRQPGLARAMHLWLEAYNAYVIMRTAKVRLSKRDLNRSFVAWLKAYDAHVTLRIAMARLRKRGLARGFVTWTDWCYDRKHGLRANAGALRYFLRYFTNRSLSHGFRSWRSFAWDGAYKKGVIQLIIKRLSQRGLTNAWNTWRGNVIRPMVGVSGRLMNPNLARAWSAWLELIEAIKHRAAAMHHLTHRGLSRGWNGWLAAWQESSQTRNASKGSMGRLMHRERVRCWNAWMEHAAELRADKAFLGRLIRRESVLCWNAWMEHAAERRAERHALRRGLGRLINRQLTSAWGAWAGLAAFRGQQLRIVRKSASKMLHSRLAAAIETWYSLVIPGANDPAAPPRGVIHALRRAGWVVSVRMDPLAGAVGAGMMKTPFAKGSSTPGTGPPASSPSLGLFDKVPSPASSLRSPTPRSPFLGGSTTPYAHCGGERWVVPANQHRVVLVAERTVDAHLLKYSSAAEATPMSRAIGFLTNRELSRGWQAWLVLFQICCTRNSLQIGLLRLMHRQLHRGWSTWAAMAAANSPLMHLARKAMHRLANRQMAFGFTTWRDKVGRPWRGWVVPLYSQRPRAIPVHRVKVDSTAPSTDWKKWLRGELGKPSDSSIYAAAVGRDGDIYCAGKDGDLRIIDPKSGRVLNQLSGHTERVCALAKMSDELLASASNDKTIRLWRMNEASCFGTLRGHKGAVSALLAVNDRILVSGSHDQAVKVWDLRDGLGCTATFRLDGSSASKTRDATKYRAPSPITNAPSCAVVSLGSREQMVAAGTWGGAVHLCDVQRGRPSTSFEACSGAVWSLLAPKEISGWSAPGMLLTAGSDGLVRLWDMRADVREPASVLAGGASAAGGAIYAMVEDEGLLITGGHDHMVKVWDCRMGRCLFDLPGHSEPVRCLAVDEHDGTLISGSTDGTVRLWQLDTVHKGPKAAPPREEDDALDLEGTPEFRESVEESFEGKLEVQPEQSASLSMAIGKQVRAGRSKNVKAKALPEL